MPAQAPLQPDILILGGGLAGTAAAICLARAGRAVTLIEREPAPKHKVCGEFLSTEALHLLTQLGVDPQAHGATPIGTVRLCSPRHTTQAPLPFPAQSLTRRCLDGLLLQTAEHAGAHILRGTAVESLTQTNGRWQANLSTGQALTAPKVLLATGKHDLRGLPRPQGPQSDLVALKMYFHLAPEQAAALENTVELLLYPEGYAGLQPVEDNTFNLCALIRRSCLNHLGGWPGFLDHLASANPHAAKRLAGARPRLEKPLAISSIPYGFVRGEALAPHLYAIGDQAAVIPSFTGDGMSIALYTGVTAAKAILDGRPATLFQPALHAQLRGQVTRATLLADGLLSPAAGTVLTTLARLWPGSLRTAASLTRLPRAAVNASDPPPQELAASWAGKAS